MDITEKIENAKTKPLTPENLNYIGDLYLKNGDKQKAISCYYEATEKLHISQKDKKLAIYKKILNISSSESKAYEKIINIFSRMGLVAEEKKYLQMLATLYLNKGEHNKLDALYRRINEIDSENLIGEAKLTKSNKDAAHNISNPVSLDKLSKPEDSETIVRKAQEKDNAVIEDLTVYDDLEEELGEKIEITTIHERIKMVKAYVISRFSEKLKTFSLYIGISFVLILLGLLLYLYKNKNEPAIVFSKKNEVVVQTNNYEIVLKELKDLDQFTGKIDPVDIKNNLFYSLSIRAKGTCIDDRVVSSPYIMISFIDTNENKFKIKDLNGLQYLKKTVFRTNICGKAAGAVFMRVVLYHDKKVNYSGISVAGLEIDRPEIIKWD